MQKTLRRARMLMRTKVSMHVETVVLMERQFGTRDIVG